MYGKARVDRLFLTPLMAMWKTGRKEGEITAGPLCQQTVKSAGLSMFCLQ
jgi:hypothetical protein